MRSRIAAALVAATLLSAAPAQAQTHFTFVSGGTLTAYGVSISPYTGTMGTGAAASQVQLYCVDYFHNAITASTGWNANLTNVQTATGTLANTRWNDVTLYKQAAWLANSMSTASNNDKALIQATIWNMFGQAEGYGQPISSTAMNAYVSGTHTTSYWYTQASSAVSGGWDASGWYVVTDVNKSSASSSQEFLMKQTGGSTGGTTTPEPASFVLMGTGLLGLAGVRRYRGRNKAA